MIEIEKGIPVEAGKPRTKYPFRYMVIGDSFALPEDIDHIKLRNAAHAYGKANGIKFTIRKTDQGLRCWRIA